jgi:hypothetical protein
MHSARLSAYVCTVTSPWRMSDQTAREKVYTFFMNDTTWTTNWPTKSGFYWIRNFITNYNKDRGRESYPFPRVVWLDKDFDIYWVGTKEISQRKEMASAEWYGPIEPPA